MSGNLRERVAAAMAVRELVRRLATLLSAEGVDLAVLKGALLQHAVYDDPAERTVNDVDLLVGEADFSRADRALVRAGFLRAYDEPGHRQHVFHLQGSRFAVDLHRELFFPGEFRLRAVDLLARARRDTTIFGAPVLLPDPYDLYAHLFGHFVHTWLSTREVHHPRDFALVAARFRLEASACARALLSSGMARPARYGLPLIDDAFARAVLAALPFDPFAQPLATAVRAIVPRLPANHGLGLLPPKLLNRSPPSALRAVAGGTLRRLRRRLR